MTPYEMICEYKRIKGIKSDNAAARELGVTRSAISMVKSGGGFSVETAWKVAEALSLDPAEVIATCELASAKRSGDEEKVQVWKQRFKSVSHSAASLFFGVALLAEGAEMVRHCILCSIDYAGRKGAKLGF